jgi:isopentenyl-diphosphate delta-isomerase
MARIVDRKHEHLHWAMSSLARMRKANGFERFAFEHQALPELSLEDVDVGVTFLGRRLRAPLLISSMTGGTAISQLINERLAAAAQATGVAMAVGSQRIALEVPDTWGSFQVVRDVAPDVLLFGNIGAVQLNYGLTAADCRWLVENLGADGLFLHLNPLQEALQAEGNTNFRGLTDKIHEVCRSVPFPVLVKEVGAGIAPNVAMDLAQAGVAAIDVSGAGGTSWAGIEGLRAHDARRRSLGSLFRDWGLPTAEALVACRARLPDFPLIASGGIEDGIQVAKALALGADLVGVAGLLLPFAQDSTEAVVERLNELVSELRIAMFAVGARDVASLRAGDRLRAVSR